MENPLVLIFIVGFLLGFMFGTYMGNKKFRLFVNKMLKGKPDTDEEDGEEPESRDYQERNRHYKDGPYRHDDRTR